MEIRSNKENPSAGMHPARLYGVIDLGTQTWEYQGSPSSGHKVMFMFELPESLMKSGLPFVVSKEYIVSTSKNAALYKMMKSWKGIEIGKGFDTKLILGEPANISISISDSDWPNIESVSGLLPKQQVAKAVNPIVELDLSNFNQKTFDALPEWIRDKIKKSPEYAELGKKPEPQDNREPVELPDDDLSDIPFN